MSRRLITVALVPTLTLGGVLLGTGPAAAGTGPWSEPSAVTGTERRTQVDDVVTTVRGDTVVLFHRTLAASAVNNEELWVAVRPAKSTAWGPARLLGHVAIPEYAARLGTSDDGSVTALWVERPDETATRAIRSAVWQPRTGGWSPTATVALSAGIEEPVLSVGPDGRAVASWHVNSAPRGSGFEVYAAELPGIGATWTRTRLAFSETGTASGTHAAVARDGSATVAWSQYVSGSPTLRTVQKVGGGGWGGAQLLGDPAKKPHTPKVAVGTDGTFVVAWQQTDTAAPAQVLISARRKAADPAWVLAGAVTSEPGNLRTSAPLIGPNGDVTLVWAPWATSERPDTALRASTRSAATGTWTAPHTLTSTAVRGGFDAVIGADGTVQVGWAHPVTSAEEEFRTASFAGGAWSTPRAFGQSASFYAGGGVAVGPDGELSAVWNKGGQIWGAGTGLTPPQPAGTPAERRDFAGRDGFPDLYAVGSTGSLLVYQGNAQQVVSAKVGGGTWPTTSTLVPFGDLDGDGCNDTLVRDAAGELFRSTPTCGEAVTPTAPSARIGTGWAGFDSLAFSGDLTGDGRPDLVARQATTGDLHLYAGTLDGALAHVNKLAAGWKNRTIVGAGDLNGDGTGDIVTREASGDLLAYYVRGGSLDSPGTTIGAGWGSFVDIVGIGDLTGDGKDDLVGRSTNGELYRYAGNGAGGIGSGTRIGTGWQGFHSIR
ncbi:VCBS repeat-containing protein [Streptomyces sp. NPDC006368]|uniref:FG-GAP repeat domain-containing protein n=1 Tax=Streptomyces sp. NPDC006368 TaxID=3156760 RepID=UPI0033B98724